MQARYVQNFLIESRLFLATCDATALHTQHLMLSAIETRNILNLGSTPLLSKGH